MPWNPYTGTYDAGPVNGANTGGAGYGTSRASDLGGWHEPVDKRSQRYVSRSLLGQERGREATANRRSGAYETALYDPEGTTNRFSDIYNKVGQAIAAPAMRDYQQTQARVGANVASRFGGGVSSEELRQGYNTGDLFSRNLGEALARLGGEQVQAGQNWTSQMGQAASQSADERDRLEQLILQGVSMGKPRKQKKGVLDYVNAAAGVIDAVVPG